MAESFDTVCDGGLHKKLTVPKFPSYLVKNIDCQTFQMFLRQPRPHVMLCGLVWSRMDFTDLCYSVSL